MTIRVPPRTRDHLGASAVEYSLLVVAIAAILVVVIYALGGVALDNYRTTCSNLDAEMASSSTC